METVHSSKSLKLNLRHFIGQRYRLAPASPSFDAYASDSSDSPTLHSSLMMKYLCSSSPAVSSTVLSTKFLLPFDTPPSVFGTPVKVEEDVLVMDGILVESSRKSNRGMKKVKTPESGGERSNSSFSSSTGSGDGGSENAGSYKDEICWYWEDTGICPFGSKCQFAHGKEEQHPNRLSSNVKPEAQEPNKSGVPSSSYGGNRPTYSQLLRSTARPYSPRPAARPFPPSPTARPFTPSPTARPFPPRPTARPFSPSPTARPIPPSPTARPFPPSSTERPFPPFQQTYMWPALINSDWSPQDDGIQVSLPSNPNPSRQEVDAHIRRALYGSNSRRKKRLPVFSEFCP